MKLFRFFSKQKKPITKLKNNDDLDGKLLLSKAELLVQNREHAKALPLFDEAIELGIYKVFWNRGMCLQILGYNLDAIDDFTNAILINPTDCNLYFCRGNSKIQIKDFEGAIDDANKAIELSKVPSPLNKDYNEYAQAQGFSSIEDLIFNGTCMYSTFQNSEKYSQLLYNKRLNSTDPDDINFINKENKKKAEILKRRLK